MAQDFDVVVIGTGTAGTGAALRLRKAGRSVAVIDWRPFGGTCALRGCDPKKMLVGGAEAVDHARRMHGKGVTGEVAIDWPELMRFKRSFTDPVPGEREQRFQGQGIATFHGHARFTGPDTLAVDGESLRAGHVVIAAGAEPVKLHIPGEEHLVSSERFLELGQLPQCIALVGGGYIAAEFSHIAARAGAQVTVLQHGPRMLKGFDADLVGWLMQAFADQDIDVRLGSKVEAVDARADGGFRVRASRDGQPFFVEADCVVHAAGRAPALEPLDLAAGGIASDHGRLQLNEFLQSTSNPRVYAAGDAAQAGPPLTPVSSLDADVVAENILQGNRRRPDDRAVPSVVFTIPALAMVGLTQAQAQEQGLRFRVNAREASAWYTARQAAQPVYGYKVLVDEQTDRILGAHLVGPHAEEVINLFALAIRHGLTARQLKDTVFAYPTAASDIGSML